MLPDPAIVTAFVIGLLAAGGAVMALRRRSDPESPAEPTPAAPSKEEIRARDGERILHQTALIASETRSAKEAFRRALALIDEFSEWSPGCVYVHREGPYRVTETSILFEVATDDPLDPLRRLIRAARPVPRRGLMGKAIATGTTTFEPKLDPQVPWASVAQQFGFEAGLAVPVMMEGEVRALLLFFMKTSDEPDPATISIVERVAGQLARVLERDRAYKANADLAAIVESTADAVIGFALDGVITSWNPGAEALYGFSAEEVLGGPIFCTIPKSREREMLDILDDLSRGKRLEYMETERVHREGARIDISVTAAPILDAEGTVIGASSIERDITESKRAARRLARYRAIVQASDDAIIGVAASGRVLSCNPGAERLFGIDADALLGKSLDPLLPSDRPNELKALLDRTRRGEHVQGHETIWLRRDGLPVEVALTVSPIVDPKGRVQGAVIVGRDISEQKRTERRLQRTASGLSRSNAELEKFAYVVSHDLKAPMRAIRGLSEWIEDDLSELMQDQTREHMQLLRGRVRRMEALLNGLLSYSRAGRVRPEPEDVDTAELVQDVIALVSPPEGFAVDVAEDMPTIRAPRAPLRQVFQNLIENAIKHHERPEGRVRVSVKKADEFFEFSVSDDGPGIDPQYHERIFEIFQTLKRRDEVEGTGMGLAIVTKVVHTFGGQIAVDSALGEGTTFRFTWPAEHRTEGE